MQTQSISRNAPCPCGSGRRYKACCGVAVVPVSATKMASSDTRQTISLEDEFARAVALHQAGRIDDAACAYAKMLEIQPANPGVLHYLGVCCYQRGELDAAAAYMREALSLNEHEPMAQNNLGLVCQAAKQYEEALKCFGHALLDDPNNAPAHNNRGLVLHDMSRFEDAANDFKRAIALRDDFVEAFTNLAKTRLTQKHFDEALIASDKAISLMPSLATAHALRGSALRELKRQNEAIESWNIALALQPDFAEAHCNQGGALYELRRYEEAATSLKRAVALRPDMPYLQGEWLHARMQCCDWNNFYVDCAAVVEATAQGQAAVSPFAMLGLPTTAAQQQACARRFVADRCSVAAEPLWRGEDYAHDKIRLAYVSADFRDHPTTHLISGLIEHHDRSHFEVIGVYIGPPRVDMWRQRIEKSFDRFFDVGVRSDEEIAQLIRELEVDIAVDAMGHTAYARTKVFALRPAPIQVNYLAFAGTMGAPYIDYLIADETVIPAAHRSYYDEKIAYLPGSYQINDSTKQIAGLPMRRADMGLPEDAFVFCCFNGHFKITPDVFDVWMRLLTKVPHSVLWLLDISEVAVRNLRQEAQQRGVSAERLAFAPKLPLAEHLARHRCADLFVDTFHFNAHTTASDALWAGLPVVTRLGETFASRVAASLLNAVSMPELIARDTLAYEALVLELATSPARLSAIRKKLAENRTTRLLFDTDRSTRHLESAYRLMQTRHAAGLPPDHIWVSDRH